MSVKIGIGFGGWPFPTQDPDELWRYVAACEELDIDSLWLSDRIVSEVMNVEPMIAMSFIAARTTKLKFGTSVLALPLRNPTVLAKEIATLDFLSKGRVLPAVGLGTEDEREFEACGSPKSQRGGRTDEAIEVMKLLWSQDNVTFHGKYHTLNDVTIRPKVVQKDLPPVWIGGRSEAAIRRTARVGDGWLVSQATPDEVAVGVSKIKALAEENGNDIEDDHFGPLFSFFIADTAEEAVKQAAPYMLRRRADVDYAEFSAFGTPDRVKELMERYIDAGAPKFVARPACAPELMMEQLELLGKEVVPQYHGKKEASVA
ncbi:MAG: LLM class flavin-dependent oxidoreductase [SAR202 cluster bacterium]|jgi:probable F420-dependent oxidoreductase|nr:LLM class flavin-dependent oxidoreductase [SAR202 cluster bacterium]